jgi:hypothetical protein
MLILSMILSLASLSAAGHFDATPIPRPPMILNHAVQVAVQVQVQEAALRHGGTGGTPT